MACEEEWIENTDMVGEGKGDGHQQGRKPRISEPVPIAWKLTLWGSEWTMDTHGRWAHWAMDGWIGNQSEFHANIRYSPRHWLFQAEVYATLIWADMADRLCSDQFALMYGYFWNLMLNKVIVIDLSIWKFHTPHPPVQNWLSLKSKAFKSDFCADQKLPTN